MPLSRRSLMIGTALLAAPAVRAARSDDPVVVVGAGAAGLAAAATLRRAGQAFVLIEARERVGGRAFTDRSLGPERPFDAGAQYIHWAERNPWKPIAARDGVRIADQSGWARTLVIDGRAATDAERASRRAGFASLPAVMAAAGGPDRSMLDAVRADGPGAVRAAEDLARLLLGEEPGRVSSQDYDGLWPGDDLWVDGYGALVARHHADLPAKLRTVATGLDWSGSGVAVETDRGKLQAAAVIVTVPLGVLASGAIHFTPRLPDATLAAVDGLGMGAYTKIALALDPASVDLKEVSDAVSVAKTRGAEQAVYFEMAPFGRALAIANLGGDWARALCEAGESAAIDAATQRLATILGGHVRNAIVGGRLAGWWTDPFARGSYSIVKPGQAGSREALRVPIADRVFFAGEALAGGGAMTVGGATLDGERAATAALKALSA